MSYVANNKDWTGVIFREGEANRKGRKEIGVNDTPGGNKSGREGKG